MADPTDAMMKALGLEMPPMPPGYEDWVYRDLPLMRAQYWADLMAVFGDGNVKILAYTPRRFDDGPYIRGQVWISPSGMANLIKHNEARQSGNGGPDHG